MIGRRLAEQQYEYGTRVERSAVDDRRRFRLVWVTDAVLFAGSIVLLLVYGFAPRGGWLAFVVAFPLGYLLGRAGFVGVRRAMAYRAGWLAGRRAMVYSMLEAQSRGMSLGQWLTSQLEVDAALLGIRLDDERGPGELGS